MNGEVTDAALNSVPKTLWRSFSNEARTDVYSSD